MNPFLQQLKHNGCWISEDLSQWSDLLGWHLSVVPQGKTQRDELTSGEPGRIHDVDRAEYALAAAKRKLPDWVTSSPPLGTEGSSTLHRRSQPGGCGESWSSVLLVGDCRRKQREGQ